MPSLASLHSLTCAIALLYSLTLSTKAADSTPAPPPGYTLVWSDDFKNDPDGLPDPNKWIYEEGFVRNHEAQYYTRARPENARIENGQLIIEARKEEFPYSTAKGSGTAHYTSAALETRGRPSGPTAASKSAPSSPPAKASGPPSGPSASAKAPPPTAGPTAGKSTSWNSSAKEPGVIHGTIHYFVNGHHAGPGKTTPLAHPENDFHVYAADWTPAAIDLSVDGHVYHHFLVEQATDNGRNPFRLPHFLLLNLALGGSWGGPIDDSIFPQRMTVDYVRVYQKTPASPQ
jgi:hypothetical protein